METGVNAVEEAELEERADDRHGADRQGHGGRDERAEDEQEEEEGQGDGELLGPQEVVLHDRVDFVERGAEATDLKGDGAAG